MIMFCMDIYTFISGIFDEPEYLALGSCAFCPKGTDAA